MLLNIPQCTGQPQEQRHKRSKMSTLLRWRSSELGYEYFLSPAILAKLQTEMFQSHWVLPHLVKPCAH